MIKIQYSENPKIARTQKIILWTVLGLSGVAAFGFVFGFLVQILWNATMAEMFGLPTISFWQAVGLFILAKFFFGFGMGGGNQSGSKTKKKEKKEGVEPVDVADLADDEKFRKYWAEEGKEAYETFTQGRAPESS